MPVVVDLPELSFPNNPLLTRKYVVLHSGVGPRHVRGQVVPGQDFFGGNDQIITTFRRRLNKETGTLEVVIDEERRMHEAECEDGLRRLLALGAIRSATATEASQDMVEIAEPVSTALVQTMDEKSKRIADLERHLAELRATAGEPTPVQTVSPATQPVVTPTGIYTSTAPEPPSQSGVPIAPPPGGRSAPRKTKGGD